MIFHLIVGDMAAQPLREAVEMEPSLAGEVVVLKDILHVGPLQKAEGQSFAELRSDFWNQVSPNEKEPIQVPDLERVLEISSAMYKDETIQAWFWMAPAPADVCAYYWLLFYLSKHPGRFQLINIAGLPFLDANGKVFFPKSFSEVLPKEMVKARRLARAVTPSEIEVDGEEWKKLQDRNGGVRTLEGGKKVSSHDENYYDAQLLSHCSQQFQKASRVVNQAMTKYSIPTGDTWLGWRLRQLAASGMLSLKGDTARSLKDWDVKLPGGEATTPDTQTEAAQTA